jgi:hypothetical protein
VALVAMQNRIGAVQLRVFCMYLAIISQESALLWSILADFRETA